MTKSVFDNGLSESALTCPNSSLFKKMLADSVGFEPPILGQALKRFSGNYVKHFLFHSELNRGFVLAAKKYNMSKYGKQAYQALHDNKLAPKKKFGQNFLVHRQTAEAIVHAGNVAPQDVVLEVGVGLGALTGPLASSVKHVYGYEIDSGIIRYHKQEGDLPDNVTLVHQDILTADFDAISELCSGKLKILANLPYSISNPFIFKLIDNAPLISSATIMLQKEVAERLMAKRNSKEYGVPTILLASCASVTKLMTLGPAEFHPRPKIDSVVIRIDFEKLLPGIAGLPPYNFEMLRRLVRTSFNQRRKTILNTLSGAGFFLTDCDHEKAMNKDFTRQAIENADLSVQARPETLGVEDFVNLSLSIEQLKKNLSI